MADQDDIPYANKPLEVGQARRLASDARVNEGQLGSYLGPMGTPLAHTGDDLAMFVRPIYVPPALFPVSLIPTEEVPSDGVLIAATVNAELHECWANDSRDDTSEARWLLLFDRKIAPTAGLQPSYTAIKLCGVSSYDFIQVPLLFATGIVIAISSTPNIYTAIADASDFSITARVLGA